METLHDRSVILGARQRPCPLSACLAIPKSAYRDSSHEYEPVRATIHNLSDAKEEASDTKTDWWIVYWNNCPNDPNWHWFSHADKANHADRKECASVREAWLWLDFSKPRQSLAAAIPANVHSQNQFQEDRQSEYSLHRIAPKMRQNTLHQRQLETICLNTIIQINDRLLQFTLGQQ